MTNDIAYIMTNVDWCQVVADPQTKSTDTVHESVWSGYNCLWPSSLTSIAQPEA